MARGAQQNVLQDADFERIAGAIERAEAHTSGEIVCVLARSSARYSLYPLVWAAAVALAAPAPLIGFTALSAQRIYLAQAIIFVVSALAFGWPGLRLLLVPRRVRRSAAFDMALRQFRLRGLAGTRGRNGVMIFVSVAERYARILVDDAVAAAIPHRDWQTTVDALVASAREGRVADGFVDAVERCGALLAGPFPPQATPVDELPDRIWVI